MFMGSSGPYSQTSLPYVGRQPAEHGRGGDTKLGTSMCPFSERADKFKHLVQALRQIANIFGPNRIQTTLLPQIEQQQGLREASSMLYVRIYI